MTLSMAINAEAARPSTASGKSADSDDKVQEGQNSEFADALQRAFGAPLPAPEAGLAAKAAQAMSMEANAQGSPNALTGLQETGGLLIDGLPVGAGLAPGSAPFAGQVMSEASRLAGSPSSASGALGQWPQTASVVQGLSRSAHLKSSFDLQGSGAERGLLSDNFGEAFGSRSKAGLRMDSGAAPGFARNDSPLPSGMGSQVLALIQGPAAGLATPTATLPTTAMTTLAQAMQNPDPTAAAADALSGTEGVSTNSRGELLTSTATSGSRAATLPGSSPVPLTGSAFGQRMQDTVQWMITGRIQHAEIHLDPEHLGPIRLQLRMDGQEAMVNFVAQHDTTRAAIEQNLQGLRDALAQAGLTLGQAQVGTQSQQQGFSDGRFAQSNAEQRQGLATGEGQRSDANRSTTWLGGTRTGQGLLDLFA